MKHVHSHAPTICNRLDYSIGTDVLTELNLVAIEEGSIAV